MRSRLVLLLMLAGLYAGCVGGGGTTARAPQQYEDPFPVLSGYGNWMEVEGLGRVWQPPYQAEWRPFTNGWWEWTDQGWMFDSDEPYGWVVYHYGDWTRLGATGWVWVPGYDWSPARVRWYSGDDFICWAPMPPARAAFPRAFDPGYEDVWVVVPANRFTTTHVGQYRTSAPLPRPGMARTAYKDRSPDVELVQRATNQPVPQRRTDREDVRNGQRTVTRVRVRQESPARPLPAPQPVVTPAPARQAPVSPAPATRERPPATPAPQPVPLPAPMPQVVPPPPPTTRPSPPIPQGKVRQPGTVRTPAVEKHAPQKPKDAEPKKVGRPQREKDAARDSLRSR